MKSFKNLRRFALQRSRGKAEASSSEESGIGEEEPQYIKEGMQVVEETQLQVDGLLSVGKLISTATNDFSRSFQGIEFYLLETLTRTRINGDETRNTLDMLGKAQMELSKFLDGYSGHVEHAIISPAERLMVELQYMKDMKNKYDKKRLDYNRICTQWANGKMKNRKRDPRLSITKMELDDCAKTLRFRLESLKQGRLSHLITQAVQFHTAQVNLFRKGFFSLHCIDPAMERLLRQLNTDEIDSASDMIKMQSPDYRSTEGSESVNEIIAPHKIPEQNISYVLPHPSSTKNRIDQSQPSQTSASTHVRRTKSTQLTEMGDYPWSSSYMGDEKSGRILERGQEVIKSCNSGNQGIGFSRIESYPPPKILRRNSYFAPSSTNQALGMLFQVEPLYKEDLKRGHLNTAMTVQISPKISPNSTSPLYMAAPQISELHRLPMPPSKGIRIEEIVSPKEGLRSMHFTTQSL